MRQELPFPDKVLQTLHNLCATSANLAKTGDEVASYLESDSYQIESVLDNYSSVNEGFAEKSVGTDGKKRYYLTAKGIIKVCSLFT